MQWIPGAWMGAAGVAFLACLVVPVAMVPNLEVQAGQRPNEGEYRVLEPLQSGALSLFPVVRNDEPSEAKKWNYITLDEGLRSGEVEVTEAGRASGMVRPRHGQALPIRQSGDRVNTLALINNSDKPLLLLAGEIVSGGKQDRVIGKDRIVPAHSDPIDLSVFCIEPGRWVGSSDKFGAVSENKNFSFMVQPSVRSKAMVQKDQQQVWNSVNQSVETAQVMAASPAVPLEGGAIGEALPSNSRGMNTTSYAKAMNDERIVRQVDSVAEPLVRSSHEVLQKLREQHAVGVVVAVHGEIIWADIFATPEMLAAYWTKLVRSYAAESFDNIRAGTVKASVVEAQKFVDRPSHGEETSEGETGLYNYREVRGQTMSSFYLQVLLPGTEFYAHISRVAEEGTVGKLSPALIR